MARATYELESAEPAPSSKTSWLYHVSLESFPTGALQYSQTQLSIRESRIECCTAPYGNAGDRGRFEQTPLVEMSGETGATSMK